MAQGLGASGDRTFDAAIEPGELVGGHAAGHGIGEGHGRQQEPEL